MSSVPPDLINDLKARIEAELQPGERVIYAGRPDWRAERGKLLGLLAIGVFWSAVSFPLAVATLAGAFGLIPFNFNGEPATQAVALAFCLLTVPMAALGGLMLAAPFLSMRKSKRTAHAITDRRFLTVYADASAEVESHTLDSVNFVKRKDGVNGAGSLEIAYGISHDADGDPRPLTVSWPGIPDVKRAEAALMGRD